MTNERTVRFEIVREVYTDGDGAIRIKISEGDGVLFTINGEIIRDCAQSYARELNKIGEYLISL